MTKFVLIVAMSISSIAASATQYSKLSIITSAKQRGCWTSLKSFIVNADLKDEWDSCQYISDDYPQFPVATNSLVSAGACTAEDIAYILTNSVDTAVADSFLRRVYDNDMNSTSGRSKWHGKKVRETISTNTMTRTTYYEDGTIFTDSAKIRTAQDSVNAYNSKLPRPAMTNGIPARLAAARIRQRTDSSTTNTVTRNITAGKN